MHTFEQLGAINLQAVLEEGLEMSDYCAVCQQIGMTGSENNAFHVHIEEFTNWIRQGDAGVRPKVSNSGFVEPGFENVYPLKIRVFDLSPALCGPPCICPCVVLA